MSNLHVFQPPTQAPSLMSRGERKRRHLLHLSTLAQPITVHLLRVAEANGEEAPGRDPIRVAELRAIAEQAVMAVDTLALFRAEGHAQDALYDELQHVARWLKPLWEDYEPTKRQAVYDAIDQFVSTCARHGATARTVIASVLSAYRHSLTMPDLAGDPQ